MPHVVRESKLAEVSQRISQQAIYGDWMAKVDQEAFPVTGGGSHPPSVSAVPMFWG